MNCEAKEGLGLSKVFDLESLAKIITNLLYNSLGWTGNHEIVYVEYYKGLSSIILEEIELCIEALEPELLYDWDKC